MPDNAAPPPSAHAPNTVIPGAGARKPILRRIELKAGAAKNAASQSLVGLIVRDKDIVPAQPSTRAAPLWAEQNQAIILHSLKSFLPKVTAGKQQDSEVHVFQLFTDRKALVRTNISQPDSRERCGESRTLRWWDRIPDTELTALTAACMDHRTRQKAPQAPPNTVEILKAVEFPDPVRDPYLYRMYGPPWDRKIAIIWGMKYPNAGLSPEAAIEQLQHWRGSRRLIRCIWFGFIPLLTVCLLVGAGLLANWQLNEGRRKQRDFALQKIDSLASDAAAIHDQTRKLIAKASEEYSDGQVIEVMDKKSVLDGQMVKLESDLRGISSFPEIAERLRAAKQNAADAHADLTSAPKLIEGKSERQAALLGQRLADLRSTLDKAVQVYNDGTSKEVRDKKLEDLGVKQAAEKAAEAVAQAGTILGQSVLPSSAKQALTLQQQKAQDSLTAYRNAVPKFKFDLPP